MPTSADTRTGIEQIKRYTLDRYRAASRRLATIHLTASQALPNLKVGVVAHVHYPELWPELLQAIGRVPNVVSIQVSATNAETATQLVRTQPAHGPHFQICVVENRGRDIPAKAAGIKELGERVDVVLFVHTKKSLHDPRLAGWRTYLLSELTRQAVSVLQLFDNLPSLGVAFPNPRPPSRETLGSNQSIMREMVGPATAARLNWRNLPFPAGSMIWARPHALGPWIEWAQAAEFPDEAGQVDGTPAHALERLVLVSCELAGMTHLRIQTDRGFMKSSRIQAARPVARVVAWRLQPRALT